MPGFTGPMTGPIFCDAKYGWYFDSIRDDPRFKALLERFGGDGAGHSPPSLPPAYPQPLILLGV